MMNLSLSIYYTNVNHIIIDLEVAHQISQLIRTFKIPYGFTHM